jgi:hypothetical protein
VSSRLSPSAGIPITVYEDPDDADFVAFDGVDATAVSPPAHQLFEESSS